MRVDSIDDRCLSARIRTASITSRLNEVDHFDADGKDIVDSFSQTWTKKIDRSKPKDIPTT